MPRLYIGNREITPAIVKDSTINNQDKTITENGVYTADEGYTGLGEVTVNVSSGQPVIQQLSVSPTRTAQTIIAPTGVDGYSPINVAAVTSSIDSNITSGNIKKNVTILGVTGTLESGITPTGTINIIQNGTYDVTNYASASVNVSGGSFTGIPREVSSTGIYEAPLSSFTFTLPSNATDVGPHRMAWAFYDCTSLTSVDLSSLTTISGSSAMISAFRSCTSLTSANLSSLNNISGDNGMSSAFYQCTSLTSVDLSSLNTISGSNGMSMAFQSCISLKSVDLSSLTTISRSSGMSYTFQYCSSLTSVDLSSLTTISGSSGMISAFYDCTSLTSVDLSSLTTISGSYALRYAFRSCTSLTSLSFPALNSNSFGSYTSQFNSMLQGVTGCTVHFPSNLQSVIGSWSDVTAGFEGTNTTVLFDLPATT